MDAQDRASQIDDILSYYGGMRDKKEQAVIVELLKELQEVNSFLTPELQQRAADTCGVTPSFIQLLIRTYPSLKKAPYAHEITMCSGARCHAKGGADLIREAKHLLKIGEDSLSADGKWLLKTQNCLKNCRTSPNMRIDGKLYSHMTKEKLRDILAKTR